MHSRWVVEERVWLYTQIGKGVARHRWGRGVARIADGHMGRGEGVARITYRERRGCG